MSLPIKMWCQAFSYDDALENTAPITPPLDKGRISWKRVIPKLKHQGLRGQGFPLAKTPSAAIGGKG
jgi:hypothetical protein